MDSKGGIGVKHTVQDATARSVDTNPYSNIHITQTIPPWIPRTVAVTTSTIAAAYAGQSSAGFCSDLLGLQSLSTLLWYFVFSLVFIVVYLCVLVPLTFILHYVRVTVNEKSADAQAPVACKVVRGEPFIGVKRLFHVENKHRKLEYYMSFLTDMFPGEKTVRIHTTQINFNDCGYVTVDPDVVRHILRDAHHKYIKTDPTNSPRQHHIYGFERLLGNGIFVADHGPFASDKGDSWRIQRKIASSIFTKNQFQTHMGEVLLRKSRDACDILDEAEGTVDMQDLFFAYTMDSICELAFGENENTLFAKNFKPEDELGGIGTEFDIATGSLVEATGAGFLHVLLIKQLQPAFLQSLGYKAFENLHPKGRKFKESVERLDKACDNLVRRRRNEENLSRSKDLLALFINAEKTHGEKLDDKLLRDVVKSFVIAGRDTTASLLSFVFLELAKNPKCKSELEKEISTLLGPDNGDDSKLTYDFVLKSMPYLRGVIYETLRLHPPVPVDFKVAAEDDVLPNGMPVLAGWRLAFFPWGMARDERLWPNPLAFTPERWIPFTQPDSYKFPVFQAGPRICAGMNLALFEASLLTAVLIRRFDFSPATGEDFHGKTYLFTLTTRVKGGVPMTVQRRQ
eukprot:m.108529 g.108529  ORF g.108529 m.108529 type:complete len:626 (-) comp13969_c0_seq1:89-1966(-)